VIYLWAEVYNAAYSAPKTNNVIPLATARITRAFDGPGSIDIDSPVIGLEFLARAHDLLTVKSVVEIWWQEEPKTPILKGAMVVEKRQFVEDAQGFRLKATGSDVMSLLLNKSTNYARSYADQTVQTVVSALLTLAGWTASYDSVSGNISTRFDGASVLKALQAIASQKGYHMRLTSTFKTLEFGAFGDSNGYTLRKFEGDHPEVERASTVIPIESMKVLDNSADIVNKIYPSGAGDGDSFLTLEQSTAVTTYTRQSETGPDGRTVYYYSDSTSITAYGTIEARVNFKKIAPTGASATEVANASDDLAIAANEWLARHKDPVEQLTVHVFKPDVNFAVGDKVAVDYIGVVNQNGVPNTLVDISGDYWILSVDESLSMSGESVALDLSNIDRVAMGEEQIIVGQVDAIDVQEVGYQATLNKYVWGPYQSPMDASNTGTSEFIIDDQTVDIDKVTLYITTTPFGSTAKSAAHRHQMFNWISSNADLAGNNIFSAAADAGAVGSTTVVLAVASSVGDIYTVSADGAQEYGVYTDTDYPDHVSITVNGTTVASNLDTSGAGLTNLEINITDEVRNKVGGFQTTHPIVASCTGGQGEIRFQIMVQNIITRGKAA